MSMSKRKILIISSIGSPPYLGGIENVIDTLVKSDLALSYIFSYFDTYRVPGVKRNLFSKIFFALSLPANCFKKLVKIRPSIAHIHFCSKTDFWKHALCLFTCKIMGVKTIFHLHGGSFDTIYEQYNPLIKSIVRLTLRQADVIVALSSYWQSFLSNLVQKEKIHIVPNPINCGELSLFSVQEANVINHSVVLLGSLGKRKGHYDVMRAAPLILQKYPDVQFYFAGLDEDPGATVALQELAKKNNISTNIHFVGPVSGVEKLKLLGTAGVVILPSYGENMPISVLEGMAAWKPVISTRVGAIPEVITHNECGLLINPGDWESLSHKLNYLFDNPSIAYCLGQKAGIMVRKNWDVGVIIKIYDRMYGGYLDLNTTQ